MKRILSYIGVGMLLLSVMTACEEDAALLNPDVGHDKSTVPEETVTSLGYFNSTTSPGNAIIQLIAGSSEQENRGMTDAGVEDEVCFVLSKPAEVKEQDVEQNNARRPEMRPRPRLRQTTEK